MYIYAPVRSSCPILLSYLVRVPVMPLEAEDMTYDDLKEVTEGLTLRSIPASVSPELPRGSFEWDAFPKDDFNTSESPMVHFYDIIFGYENAIDFDALGKAYKNACDRHDLQLLPDPFGLKKQVSPDTRMQIVILKDTDSNHAILKHLTCPEKVKPNMVRSLVYGTPYRAKWMTQNPKVGRKVLQLKRFELSSAATRKPATRQVHLKTKTMMKLMQVLTISSSMALGLPLKMPNFDGKPKTPGRLIPPSMVGLRLWLTKLCATYPRTVPWPGRNSTGLSP